MLKFPAMVAEACLPNSTVSSHATIYVVLASRGVRFACCIVSTKKLQKNMKEIPIISVDDLRKA